MKSGVPKTQSEVKDLKRLRQLFLNAPDQAGTSDYWSDYGLLKLYDTTFARRIAWKWEAVLGELVGKNWSPSPQCSRVIDWGCGSGVASEVFFRKFGTSALNKVVVSDRSSLAKEYTSGKLSALFPNLQISALDPTEFHFQKGDIVLISHVLTELTSEQFSKIQETLSNASCIIWVEPGTPFCSQRLISLRENLIQNYKVISPCPHQGRCGLKGESRDWCHFFAQPPSEIFQSSEFTQFSKEMDIDLRSLPVSYLVLQERDPADTIAQPLVLKRVLGRPRFYKGYSKLTICHARGVQDENVPERNYKAKFKLWRRDSFCLEFTSDQDYD